MLRWSTSFLKILPVPVFFELAERRLSADVLNLQLCFIGIQGETLLDTVNNILASEGRYGGNASPGSRSPCLSFQPIDANIINAGDGTRMSTPPRRCSMPFDDRGDRPLEGKTSSS